MTHFYVLLLALGIGVVAGLRSFTAPAVVAWAAYLRWINLTGLITVIVFTLLAAGELVLDKLPKTPSRTAPPSFVARLVSGGFAGAVIGSAWGFTWSALGAGVVGAVLGTLGGYQARARLAGSVALFEDAVTVGGGFALAAVAAAL